MICTHCNCDIKDNDEIIVKLNLQLVTSTVDNLKLANPSVFQAEDHLFNKKDGKGVHKHCFLSNLEKHGIKGRTGVRPFTSNH